MGFLASHPGQHRRLADGVLGLAARPAAPGALPSIQLAWPVAGPARHQHAGDRSGAGRAAGLVCLAADLPVAHWWRPAAGAVLYQRMVAAATLLQAAAAGQAQPEPRAADT